MAGVSITNQQFLNTMFNDMPDCVAAMTCSFSGDPFDDSGDRKFKWHAKPWRPGTATLHLRSTTNNYVCISNFTPDPDTGQWRRRKAQFSRMHALMLDDIGTKIAKNKIRLPLSALIETSPGNFQGWHFLAKSPGSCDFATADATLKAMIASKLTADGADPGMNGVTRVGRLPVGVNGKEKYVRQLGHPFQCRAVAWNPERRYSIEDIVKAYKLNINAHTHTRTSGSYSPSGARNRLPRGEATKRVNEFERMMKRLADGGLYLASRGAWHDIICPWVDEHTDAKVGGSALYIPAASNDWLGGFKCHHGHCEHRTVGDVYRFTHLLAQGAA